MNHSPLRRLLPLIALLLSSLAALAAPPESGLPVGTWRREFPVNSFNNRFSLISTFTITPAGTTQFQKATTLTYKAGYHMGYGKFAGRTHLSWTTTSMGGKAARVGDEVYIYSNPSAKVRLLAADPPGYSLEDYESLGGGISKEQQKSYGDPNGVNIFKIKGRDLLLVDSNDRKEYLYKRVH